MTIKKKIRLSNIMMVLIPILFTLVVLIVCLNTSLGSYWHTFMDMYSDENGMQFAQSMIYNYQQELWENNWGQCPEMDDCQAEIRHSDEMTHLEHKLSGLGYRFMITKDGERIYSNLSEEDLDTARSVAGDAIDYAKMLTASRYEVSVIKSTFWHGESIFCITAVHPQETDGTMVNYLKNGILRYLAGILVLFVALTVCINGVLSWWISGSILKPLGKLSLGTKEIREGNLDTPMQYEKRDEFGQVCRDFDEMRIYLQESVQQRLKDEKRRRNLITGISHDLRTPLTTIMGYLDGLLDGIADTPEKQLRYLQAIKTRTGNLVSLVDSLSEYSRLDAGFRYHMEDTDFKDYVEKYLELVRPDMENQQVQIAYSCGKGSFSVRLDREEFKRIFNNLFVNTVRYRRKENSRVLISMKRKLEGNCLELVFQDDGPGVPGECLEQIFDSFYRVDDSRNSAEKGSGIGLAVVKEIILGHGGTIRAENRGGLAVIINIPVTDGERKCYVP